MSPRLQQLLQYTAVAATTLHEIAGYTNVPFLQAAATGATAILNAAQGLRSNEEQVATMLEQIHEILCAVIHLYTGSQTDGALSPALLYDIAKFTETLQKIHAFMKTQQGMGKFKQLFKQFDSATQLKDCQEELQGSLARFRLQSSGTVFNGIVAMQQDAQRRHDELLALLATHPDLTNSDRSSKVTGTLSTFGDSSDSLSLLPAYPQIFHGRDRELAEIVSRLKSNSARVAILGAGGMGKTSLCIAALHDPEVAKKFKNRYFVPCHSNGTRSSLVSSIASHLGVAEGPSILPKVLRHLTDGPPALLILDNFETPWEPMSSRTAVEELLSLLADIPHLALVVTMRGAERPNRVKWTRPFIQPLEPLEDAAALQTFCDIAGDDHEESLVHELLNLSGNLPLAVDLIANVVVYDGCATTLARWQTESTRVVSDGYDKKSSLDISIMLSFSSARMTPEAQALLSLLSILPNGLSDLELVHSNLPIVDIRGAQTTLLRTALAQVGRSNCLSVLMPIREHIRGTHPPQRALKAALREYYHKAIALWQFRVTLSSDLVAQLSASLGNMQAIFEDGLRDPAAAEVTQTLRSAITLNAFSRVRHGEASPLMPLVEEIIVRFPTEQVYGDFFVEMFYASTHRQIREPELQITLGQRYFDNETDVERKAQWLNALASYCKNWGSNFETALQYEKEALAMGESLPHPTKQLRVTLSAISITFVKMGKFVDGRAHAQKAQQIAAILNDLQGLGEAFGQEAWCCMAMGSFTDAAQLVRQARELMFALGLEGSTWGIRCQIFEAEIHLLKTEYPAARAIYSQLMRRTAHGYDKATALLNLAIIDIAMGAPATAVRASLDTIQLQFATTAPVEVMMCEAVNAVLALREGGVAAARASLERLFPKLRAFDMELGTFCLERLADPDHGMHDGQTTLMWAALYLGFALSSRSRLSTMKALKCLGQIAAADGDTATAMSLFRVALDGFTFMDIHQERADCMMRMSEIHLATGEALRAKELFEAAEPLFDCCMVQRRANSADIALKLAGLGVRVPMQN
ncbi:hypothetical protein GGX14DRAFT_698881 [Mycena pura]|uniref:Novel STAND NTPase 1 domain-containing protein n=1 Tax=Mycena pura TaxID=153505 RepID=A0AAD6V919_9AGAR|nr:hypothetical protein GGX14DRAFT_698881 [Mycena pura]